MERMASRYLWFGLRDRRIHDIDSNPSGGPTHLTGAGRRPKQDPSMTTASNLLALVMALFAVAALVLWPGNLARAAQPAIYTGLVKGVAVGGYDPVAYFTQRRPVKGSPQITLEHEGATWRFASEESRAAFQADPGKYAPQYGGYCAYAVALGYTAKGDPEAWSIVEGKLYLNFNLPTKATWEKDTAGYIAKSEKNWPGVLEK